MLYGPALSQSDCRKAGPYQLPCNESKVLKIKQGTKKYFKAASPDDLTMMESANAILSQIPIETSARHNLH